MTAPGALDHLRTLVGHHTWATLGLLDHCLSLSPAQLELNAPGTYGSIHATLEHLVRADRRYLGGISGGGRIPPPEALPPVAELRADMERQAKAWSELLARVDEVDVTLPEDPGEFPEIEHAVGLFLVQAVHHGNDHRTHVCTILGAHGLEAPELSGWEYIRFLASAR